MSDDQFLQSFGLISGWRGIAKFLDVSIRTAQRYAKKYYMPVRNWPGGRPWVIPAELIEWGLELDRLTKKRANSGQEKPGEGK
jgi:hypothetical protein